MGPGGAAMGGRTRVRVLSLLSRVFGARVGDARRGTYDLLSARR